MQSVKFLYSLVLALIFFGLSKESAKAFDLIPDLKVGLNGRTYPIGAQTIAAAGLGVPLWGSTDQWKYGYARLLANGAAIGVVNRVGLEFQVFPISILGVSVGFDTGTRNFTPKFVNCSIYECNGRVDRSFTKLYFVAAAKGIILSFTGRYEVVESFRSEKLFFDEMTLLSGHHFGEHLLILNPVLLYQINKTWTAGAVSLYNRALETGGASHMYGPLFTWTDQSKWTIAAGVGLNESPLIHTGITAYFTFQYTLAPSISVNDMMYRKKSYSSLF